MQLEANTLWGLLALVFGGGGVWAFLRSMRGATSTEYQSFVKDLQAERRDRQSAIERLERRLRRQDARILKLSRAIALKDLEFSELESHVGRLEGVITDLGGKPPQRPLRLQIQDEPDDEEEIDEETPEESGPPASGGGSKR